MRPVILFFLCMVIIVQAKAQSAHIYNPALDIKHYTFNLELNDANDTITGNAVITVQFLQNVSTIHFDLTNLNDTGKGMQVLAVTENDTAVMYHHQNNLLEIQLKTAAAIGEKRTYAVTYKGVPTDGLIIARNKYSHRTFFADNWPNRAHNWLPCVDHLSDKAAIDFIITAPDHYQVISNGIKTEETNLDNHRRLTHWHETVDLPTKVMALGVADFAVNYAGDAAGIPVYSWVFPEDRDKGFYDYAQAVDILPYFIKNVGPYSYRKLANVQSKTIFGGLENAGTIFYSQNSITGTRKSEELLAHEIAHQWFGDAATETNWAHLWLSEGFATYFTNLYLENKYGTDTLQKRLEKQRNEVIEFSKKRHTPVVDTTVTQYMQLLNANSYQKGGWVLHMLRRKLGDTLFWKGIQQYYAAYRGKNASTDDLRLVFEQVSGINLEAFFQQWLFTPGQPMLAINWQYVKKKKSVIINITQQQPALFAFPLQLAVADADNAMLNKVVEIRDRQTQIVLSITSKPQKIVADPGINLLFGAVISEKK